LLGVVELPEELLEELPDEVLVVMVLGCPQPARDRNPAAANERAMNLQRRQFISERLAGRSCEYRRCVPLSLVSSNSASQTLQGNRILERIPAMNFTETGI
jgi:hypothetical protein